MTEEIKNYIEQQHNVYVDAETELFNLDGYDSVYGWDDVPKEWIEEAKAND